MGSKKGAIKKRREHIKKPKELEYLKKAAKITSEIFAIISRRVKSGARETEIANEIENIIKERHLKRSFKTIVASGLNAAKPHAKVTKRIIKDNDVVVIDFGVVYKRFHSDMTRTAIVGKINPKMHKLYKTVRAAQKIAIERIIPGLRISELVSGVYDYIRKKGFGKYILHSLGHGLGIKIHEPPKLSEKNRNILKRNMVITIEPGLYIRGIGGVRIEDMIWVRKNGSKVLTR